jgi:glycine cleavage system H protein
VRRREMYPEDYYYSKDHEWIKVENGEAVVGITDFAQKQLGDVVYVELPEVGAIFEFHQSLGVIESVKAVSDIYSPISGEVVAINEELDGSPEVVNEDPHGKGWIVRLKLGDETEIEKLMSANEYEKFLEGLED